MEMQGLLMRGAFESPATTEDHEIEWCERRILQRIHRRTMSTLRKQIEAVTPAVYMRWLLGWQHLAPQTQLSGEEGVLEALHQLEGLRLQRLSGSGHCFRRGLRTTIRGGWMRCVCRERWVGDGFRHIRRGRTVMVLPLGE